MNPFHRDGALRDWWRWQFTSRLREWQDERRTRREAALDKEASWFDDLTDEEGAYMPGLIPDERKGRRHSGRHARPGDIPNQPPAGRES